MKYFKLNQLGIGVALGVLVGLNGCTSSSSSDSEPVLKSDVNIALLSNGASAMATVNNSDANNSIDDNNATSWGSISGSSLIVKFSEVNTIKSFAIKKSDGQGVSAGSNPDILVELSKDGETYETSQVTTFGISGTIGCMNTSLSASNISCDLTSTFEAQYIKITTQNGESYAYDEIEVISYK